MPRLLGAPYNFTEDIYCFEELFEKTRNGEEEKKQEENRK